MKKKLSLSIVIPTKDRHELLKRILNYLKKNAFFFNEVLVIDSSKKNIFRENEIKNNFKKLNIKYYNTQPSTSMQRNLGLKHINKKKTEFICLFFFKKNPKILFITINNTTRYKDTPSMPVSAKI